MQNINYQSVVDEEQLLLEVANGTYAFMNKIKQSSINLLWSKLCKFIVDVLKTQKGVLLPNLGTFRVGPVVGETRKKIRPAFSLLEGRYGNVSQEKTRYVVGGKPTIVQPNYSLLATASGVHRGCCQRILFEILQRLSAYLVAGRVLKVSFPGLGHLQTNRAGRLEFLFNPLLMELFEHERQEILSEMEQDFSEKSFDQTSDSMDIRKGLKQVYLHDPPLIKGRPSSAASRPSTAASQGSRPGSAGPITGATHIPVGGSTRRASSAERIRRLAHQPYRDDLLDLWKLCRTHDKINSGCVPRLKLEQWLHRECRDLLTKVDAATVMELLAVHTYGKTAKHILYKPFLDGLESTLRSSTSPKSKFFQGASIVHSRDIPRNPSGSSRPTTGDGGGPRGGTSPTRPASAASGRARRLDLDTAAQDVDEFSEDVDATSHGRYDDEEEEETPRLAVRRGGGSGFGKVGGAATQRAAPAGGAPQKFADRAGGYRVPGLSGEDVFSEYDRAGDVEDAYGDEDDASGLGDQEYGSRLHASSGRERGGYAAQDDEEEQDARRFESYPEPALASRRPYPLDLPPSSGGEDSIHYQQQQLQHRGRHEYDEFNRMHFQELESSRGKHYKSTVTPKVGEEPLNVQAFHQTRQTPSAASSAGGQPRLFERRVPTPLAPPPFSLHNEAMQTARPAPPKVRGSSQDMSRIFNHAPDAAPSNNYNNHNSYGPGSGARPPVRTPLSRPGTGASRATSTPRPGSAASLASSYFEAPSRSRADEPSRPSSFATGTPLGAAWSRPRPSSAMPPPQSFAGDETPAAISQYDIINELDPVLRQRKRNELASVLQQGWDQQIQQRERIQQSILHAERQWPYV